MLEHILIGVGFAFAAAVQPGPFQAFLLARTVENGWKRTLPAAFAPLLSDIPIILLVLFVLNNLSENILLGLQIAGGLLLIYLGIDAYRRSQKPVEEKQDDKTGKPRTLFEAALINLLNPNPYLSWALVLGPAFMEAWRQKPSYGASLIIAFYAVMVGSLLLLIILFGTTTLLGPRGRRILVLASAVIMAAVGLYQLGTSLYTLFT